MNEASPADFLNPLFPRNQIDIGVAVIGSTTSAASVRRIQDLGQQSLDLASADSLLTVGVGTEPIQVGPAVFVAFVSSLLEQVRGRSLARGSVYAVRVRDPVWFHLEKNEIEEGLVPGIEVGSLLGDGLALATPEDVLRTLEVLAKG